MHVSRTSVIMNDLQRRLHLLSLQFPFSSASTVPKLISRTTMMPRKKGRRKHILCETRKKERARGFSPKMPRVVDGDAGARDQREKVGFNCGWLTSPFCFLDFRLPTSFRLLDFLPREPSTRKSDATQDAGKEQRPDRYFSIFSQIKAIHRINCTEYEHTHRTCMYAFSP